MEIPSPGRLLEAELTRWLFPQDRLTFRYGAPGTPLYSPQAETVTICTDTAGTVQASIQDPNGNPIDSVLDIGADCLIPQFLGPDNATVLYAKNSAGTITPLFAQAGQFFAGSVLALPDVTAAPATPASGGVLFVQGGALKYLGSSGTTTTLGPA